jgi:DedD protein
MRFEIKSGGVAAILVGLAALSGAVFMLGLLAGYDVGRESQSSAAQVATAYPVAAPPAAGAAPPAQAAVASDAAASATPPSAAAMPSPNPATLPPLASAKPAAAAKHPKRVAHALASEDVGSDERDEAPPPSGDAGAPPAGADTAGDSGDSGGDSESGAATGETAPPPAASAPVGAHPRHKPFNIQIQAAMDRGGASEMVHRLQALGYQPHLVPTQLNGETWYKVVIGPYPTQEAAAAAQQAMRAKYNNIYGGGAAPSNRGANPSD